MLANGPTKADGLRRADNGYRNANPDRSMIYAGEDFSRRLEGSAARIN